MNIITAVIIKKTHLLTSCRKRAPYIAYLTRCRQGLQTSQAHLERLLQRVLRDKEVANRYFTTVCVRILLEHMEAKMLDFIKGNLALHPDKQFPLERRRLSFLFRFHESRQF